MIRFSVTAVATFSVAACTVGTLQSGAPEVTAAPTATSAPSLAAPSAPAQPWTGPLSPGVASATPAPAAPSAAPAPATPPSAPPRADAGPAPPRPAPPLPAAARAARAPDVPAAPAEEASVLTVTKAREQCWMAQETQKVRRDLDTRLKLVEKCVNEKMNASIGR